MVDDDKISFIYYKGVRFLPEQISIYEEDVSRYISENIVDCINMFDDFNFEYEFEKDKFVWTKFSDEKINVDMYGLSRDKVLSKLREYIELMRQFWTKRKVSKKSEFTFYNYFLRIITLKLEVTPDQ